MPLADWITHFQKLLNSKERNLEAEEKTPQPETGNKYNTYDPMDNIITEKEVEEQIKKTRKENLHI